MIRFIPFLLYFWLIAIYQIILKDVTSIYSISINLPVLLVLLVALYKSELTSGWFGFAVGLVTYVGSYQIIGWYALIMALIGFLAFHIRERLNLDSLYARLLLIFGGVFVHNITTLVLIKSDGFFFLLWSQALPGAVYTTFIARIFFLFKEGNITLHKFKSIF